MKKYLFYFIVIVAALSACSPRELTNKEAADLLRKEFNYPQPFEYELNLVDPLVARKVAETNLVETGMVTVLESWSPAQAADPKISFTEQGKKFFIGTPKDRKAGNAAIVKLADIDLAQVLEVKKIDDQHAELSYTTAFTNITPFSVLVNRPYDKPETRTASFTFTDGKWQLNSNP